MAVPWSKKPWVSQSNASFLQSHERFFSTATYSNPPKDRKHMKKWTPGNILETLFYLFGAYYAQPKSRTKTIHHYFLHPRSWTWCPNGVLGPTFRTSSTPRSWFYMVQSEPQPSHSPVMKDPGATTTANGSTFAMWPTSDYSIVRWDRGMGMSRTWRFPICAAQTRRLLMI